jgi:hypothetical protein
MDEDERGQESDVFSPESEAQLCEQVLGDARHGLAGANGSLART